jgi:hypothetical protein
LFNAATPDDRAIFGRAAEYVEKLSLLFCISRQAQKIGLQDIASAETIVYQLIADLFQATRNDIAEHEHQRRLQRFSKVIKQNSPIGWSNLLRKAQRVGSSKVLHELRGELLELGDIELNAPETKDDDGDAPKQTGIIIKWTGVE